jgi:hypothetical protein
LWNNLPFFWISVGIHGNGTNISEDVIS